MIVNDTQSPRPFIFIHGAHLCSLCTTQCVVSDLDFQSIYYSICHKEQAPCTNTMLCKTQNRYCLRSKVPMYRQPASEESEEKKNLLKRSIVKDNHYSPLFWIPGQKRSLYHCPGPYWSHRGTPPPQAHFGRGTSG